MSQEKIDRPITIRLTKSDYEDLKMKAEANERSITQEVRFIIKQYLKK